MLLQGNVRNLNKSIDCNYQKFEWNYWLHLAGTGFDVHLAYVWLSCVQYQTGRSSITGNFSMIRRQSSSFWTRKRFVSLHRVSEARSDFLPRMTPATFSRRRSLCRTLSARPPDRMLPLVNSISVFMCMRGQSVLSRRRCRLSVKLTCSPDLLVKLTCPPDLLVKLTCPPDLFALPVLMNPKLKKTDCQQ